MGSDGKPAPLSSEPESSSFSRILHLAVLALLIAAGLAYWLMRPASLNPMADARAAEAMALVQTHRAQHAPTLLQAVTEQARAIESQGRGVRLGEWRVERQAENVYLVKVIIREQGTKQWFEREYLWRADLARRGIQAVSLPAIDLMPSESEDGPRQPL